MTAATEKQIAFIESLVRKLRTQPVRSAFGGKKGIEAFKRQVETYTAEVEADMPTLTKNRASGHIENLIAMSR